MVLEKEKCDKNPIFSTSSGSVAFNRLIFLFPKPYYTHHLLHHHLYHQFLYPTNFLVRECFSLLVIVSSVDLMPGEISWVLRYALWLCTRRPYCVRVAGH